MSNPKADTAIAALEALMPERRCSACGEHFTPSPNLPKPRLVPALVDGVPAGAYLTFACSEGCDGREGVWFGAMNLLEMMALALEATRLVQSIAGERH